MARRGGSLLRDWLSIGQQVVSNCIVHHLSFLGYISLSFAADAVVISGFDGATFTNTPPPEK